MSKITFGLILTLLTAGLLPFVFIARSRASRSDHQPIHLVLDMDHQPRFDPQSTSEVFADGRAMRPRIEGTVAKEDMVVHSEILNDNENPHLIGNDIDLTDPSIAAAVTLGRVREHGLPDDKFDALKPPASDAEFAKDKSFYVRVIPNEVKGHPRLLLHRGQERLQHLLRPLPRHGGLRRRHGQRPGPGPDGGRRRQQWHLLDPAAEPERTMKILDRPDGHIFNTITNGIRNMPPYDKQITIMDRWAIVALCPHCTAFAARPSPGRCRRDVSDWQVIFVE